MRRTHSAIHRVAEPNPYSGSGPVNVLQSWLIQFPQAYREDCESFFISGGFGYLIRKIPIAGKVSGVAPAMRISGHGFWKGLGDSVMLSKL